MSNRTPATEQEKQAVYYLKRCGFAPAGWDKRFVRQLPEDALTEKERPQVWRLFIRYRRQIERSMRQGCETPKQYNEATARFDTLMHYAAIHAAPDFRRLAAGGNGIATK